MILYEIEHLEYFRLVLYSIVYSVLYYHCWMVGCTRCTRKDD